VGSASATGSVGGRTTTWASGSTRGDTDYDTETDKMSTDTNFRDIDERDRYSAGDAMDRSEDGMSDGNASLVGFGEGAGSTISGPTYGGAINRSNVASPVSGNRSSGLQNLTDGASPSIDSAVNEGRRDGRTSAAGEETSEEVAERIVRERLDEGEGKRPVLGTPDERGLGKFYFEGQK
jgi:hypothetical protein